MEGAPKIITFGFKDYFTPGWFWPPSWLKRVCFRYNVFSAHKAIILNVGMHYARSQPNTTPYRHTFGETHLFFPCASATDLLLPQVLCLCLSCCFSWSSAQLKGEGSPYVWRRCLWDVECVLRKRNTNTKTQRQKRHVLWFSASFYGGKQYLRVIFSAVRMCSMLQFQGWY